MSILVIGVNHRSGPLDLLERVNIPADRVGKTVAGLAMRDNIREAVVLSTCNRTEIYVVTELFHGAYADVRDFLCELGDLGIDQLTPHLYSQHDTAAVRHLFDVAAGLDELADAIEVHDADGGTDPQAAPTITCRVREFLEQLDVLDRDQSGQPALAIDQDQLLDLLALQDAPRLLERRLRRRRQTQAAIEVGGELRGGLLARTVAHAHLALALDRDDTLIREHVGRELALAHEAQAGAGAGGTRLRHARHRLLHERGAPLAVRRDDLAQTCAPILVDALDNKIIEEVVILGWGLH